MTSFKAQVAEVSNGFLVAFPPTDGEIRAAQVSQRQPEGRTVYCEDYEAVCNTLKSEWPKK